MQLALSTWLEMEVYLKESRGVIVPIGSTEQHGPTGLIGTDAICAEVIARGVGRAAEAMVAPTINLGMSEHHMAFPGTMTLKPSTLLAVVRDVILSLARHGFERFFFINGHGGNMPTIKAAFYEAYAAVPPRGRELRLKAVNWWESKAVAKITKELFGAANGSHATASEISLALTAHPERVKEAPLAPIDSGPVEIYGPEDFRRRYPDGRIGSDPSLASAEHGQRIYQAAVTDLAEMYREFIAAD